MWPILISVGSVHIYSLSVFLILSWLVFSFCFWRQMKEYGVDDEKIYDLTFYGTIVALIASRLTFVILHWSKFYDNLLKVAVVWVLPGLSMYGAIIGMTLFLAIMLRRYKIRLGYLLDSLAWSLPPTLIVGFLGGLLDGSRVGKPTGLIWAVKYIGYPLKRHPVQIYEIVSLIAIMAFIFWLYRKSLREKWIYGMVGAWFFLVFGLSQFMLEFLKENSIYWLGLSFNQWVALAIVCETSGALYIKGGGKVIIRKAYSNLLLHTGNAVKGVIDAISKRTTRRDPPTS
jgi:prolipoprotein diacylglyceryltransferase